jgi:hypothetical protein
VLTVTMTPASNSLRIDYEWCPTLASAMPVDTIWPGKSHKADVEAEQDKVRAALIKASKTKND